MIVYQNITLN